MRLDKQKNRYNINYFIANYLLVTNTLPAHSSIQQSNLCSSSMMQAP